jgi:predicted MFS family arabinose efflux permease
LRDREFLKFWLGESVSLIGSQVTLLALPLTAILLLGATPLEMGVLGAVEFAPFLLLTLPAGAWVDRLRRRPVMVIANLARAVLIAIVPLGAVLGSLSYSVLLVVAFGSGCFAVFFEVASLSYLPSLVGRAELQSANSRIFASISVAEVVGPGLGGILITVLSAPVALAADAVSFLVSAVSLIAIRRPEPVPESGPRRDLRAEIVEGLRTTFGHPLLRPFALEAATFNLFSNVLNAAFLLYATHQLRLDPAALGAVFAVGALGSLGGSVVAGRIARRFGLGSTIVAAMVVACSVYLVIPFLEQPGSGSTVALASVLAIAGATISITVIHVMTIRQSVTPDRLLARMNASYRFLGYGIMPLGAVLGGLIGEAYGLRAALAVGAIGIAAAPLWVVFSRVPRLRTLDDALGEDVVQPMAAAA